MTNYNTTIGKKYPRVKYINVEATDKANEFSVTVTQCNAIVESGGGYVFVDDGSEASFNVVVDTNDTTAYPVVNPATGDDIPNLFTNDQQVFLFLLAAIRKRQKMRDEIIAQGR